MASLDKQFLEAVVLFEEKRGRKYHSLATGFLVGFKSKTAGRYHTFVVTNKHVLNNRAEVHISLDLLVGRRQRVHVPLTSGESKAWFAHRYKAVDLGMLPISIAVVNSMGAAHKWIPEEQFLYFKDYEDIGFSPGDDVFFMGFPLGLAGKLKNTPLVRKGCLSRADKELLKESKSVLIDGQNFPGNSGGPVFTRPELAGLTGSKNIDRNYLLGAIHGYLPYTSRFIDPSSGSVAAMSVENSGLALYVPIDYAKQIYNAWVRAGKPTAI